MGQCAHSCATGENVLEGEGEVEVPGGAARRAEASMQHMKLMRARIMATESCLSLI